MATKTLTRDTTKLRAGIYDNASPQFQENIPEPTATNLQSWGVAFDQFPQFANEFIHALVDKIGRTVYSQRIYENPLRELIEVMPYGANVEEVFIDRIKAISYKPIATTENATETLKTYLPEVHVMYHKQNRQDVYPVSINQSDFKLAFTSPDALNSFVDGIMAQLPSSNEEDEFVIIKGMLNNYRQRGMFYDVKVPVLPASDDGTVARAIAKTIREYSRRMTFKNRAFNSFGVSTFTPLSDQILMINPSYEANLDVEVLAYAFNQENARSIAGKVVVLDDFGGNDTDDTVATLVDRSFFKIYRTLEVMNDQENALFLGWNFFLHIWGVYSLSVFSNAIRFTTANVATDAITSVSISPTAVTLSKSQLYQFVANVVKTGNAQTTLVWSVTGGNSRYTIINPSGHLEIGADETSTELKITATSVFDSTKNATATVTIA